MKGYGTEATALVVQYAFGELHLLALGCRGLQSRGA